MEASVADFQWNLHKNCHQHEDYFSHSLSFFLTLPFSLLTRSHTHEKTNQSHSLGDILLMGHVYSAHHCVSLKNTVYTTHSIEKNHKGKRVWFYFFSHLTKSSINLINVTAMLIFLMKHCDWLRATWGLHWSVYSFSSSRFLPPPHSSPCSGDVSQ